MIVECVLSKARSIWRFIHAITSDFNVNFKILAFLFFALYLWKRKFFFFFSKSLVFCFLRHVFKMLSSLKMSRKCALFQFVCFLKNKCVLCERLVRSAHCSFQVITERYLFFSSWWEIYSSLVRMCVYVLFQKSHTLK